MTHVKMNTLLLKVARNGIQVTCHDDVIRLACAYWHEGFVPALEDIERLSENQQVKAGYITEFFSTFNCVDRSQALKLLEVSATLKTRLRPVENKSNTDEIAAEWGLSENLNKFHKDFLFYQTRHYKHKKL